MPYKDKDKQREVERNYREKNRETIRQKGRERYYRYKAEGRLVFSKKRKPPIYSVLLEAQSGVCAICGNPETMLAARGNKVRSLTLDHNHLTGEIRGLLCTLCNLMIGNALDNPEVLRKGANYLERETYTGHMVRTHRG